MAQNLAPKLVHEAFCEPVRKKPMLAAYRRSSRDFIQNHRKKGETSHNQDMLEFCKGRLLTGEGGETLSKFPTMRLDEFYMWRSRSEKAFLIRPMISSDM